MSGGSYYVPDQSRFPIFMAFSLFVLVMGASSTINNLDDPTSNSVYILYFGFACLFTTLFFWFRQVIKEHLAGLDSNQLKQSYVYGMAWFIFSEVMFFAAFFGALFYVRTFAVPWLAGEGAKGGTLVVNLEPCCHQGLTPPCTEAVLAAGVAKVVVALKDPDPRVKGNGIKRLREAGLEVLTGVLENEAAFQNRFFTNIAVPKSNC